MAYITIKMKRNVTGHTTLAATLQQCLHKHQLNYQQEAAMNNGCDKVKPQCPAENSGDAILLPNPDDCGSYCVCDWGNAIWMPCPSATPSSCLTLTTADPTPDDCGSYCVCDWGNAIWMPCPSGLEFNPKLHVCDYPSSAPDDCGSYCVCDWGNAIWMPCPSGLEFNPKLHVCDYPSSAGCSGGGGGGGGGSGG
ncbi:uncharacterized protein, partial [Hetaerina americana]|uniref:uncharacterized protein n=1 Tax=Hetaerina americana TaxID=62018 RepID=UPI003A7F227F